MSHRTWWLHWWNQVVALISLSALRYFSLTALSQTLVHISNALRLPLQNSRTERPASRGADPPGAGTSPHLNITPGCGSPPSLTAGWLRLCFQPRRPAAHRNAPPGSDVKPLEAGGPGSGPALAAARCAVWGSRAGLKRKGNVKWFKWGIIPQIANFKKKQLLQIVCKQLLCWNSTRAVLNDKCWKEKSVQREAVILPQEKKTLGGERWR